MESDETVEKEVKSQAPVHKLSAAQLWAEYDANEVAADQKYKGKVIEVSGQVDNIGKDITDAIYVTLSTGEYLANVQCFFSDKHADAAAQLRKGQAITVRGRCDGMLMNVFVKGCVISKQ